MGSRALGAVAARASRGHGLARARGCRGGGACRGHGLARARGCRGGGPCETPRKRPDPPANPGRTRPEGRMIRSFARPAPRGAAREAGRAGAVAVACACARREARGARCWSGGGACRTPEKAPGSASPSGRTRPPGQELRSFARPAPQNVPASRGGARRRRAPGAPRAPRRAAAPAPRTSRTAGGPAPRHPRTARRRPPASARSAERTGEPPLHLAGGAQPYDGEGGILCGNALAVCAASGDRPPHDVLGVREERSQRGLDVPVPQVLAAEGAGGRSARRRGGA